MKTIEEAQAEAEEQLHKLKSNLDCSVRELNSIVSEVFSEFKDAIGPFAKFIATYAQAIEDSRDAVKAQPALLESLRQSEEALSQALVQLRAEAPSPIPTDWHMREPQWAIRNALDQAKRTLDQHLC
jgi:ABC-type transporter Mla subunit MlaD